MNLLLLAESELNAESEVTLTGRRLRHAREVLRSAAGDTVRVGVRNGRVGSGTVVSLSEDELRLRVSLTEEPPQRAGVDLLLAIPRPKQLKRVIQTVSSLGVDRVVLVNAARVEKSYFDSKVLTPEFIDELVVQGLEQARDTRAPQFLIRERFKPFVEDELESVFKDSVRLLAHPSAQPLQPCEPGQRVTVAIGPEGGWVPFEVELLQQRGFKAFSAGDRILRTEAAVPFILGRLTRGD